MNQDLASAVVKKLITDQENKIVDLKTEADMSLKKYYMLLGAVREAEQQLFVFKEITKVTEATYCAPPAN